MARGTAGAGYVPGMPAFAGRLDQEEVRAVLAYVKSRWPAGLRGHQARPKPKLGEVPGAAWPRGPNRGFPGGCLLPPPGADDR